VDSHVALLLGLAALLLGPLLAGALSRSPRAHAALDGFVLCIVAGLCLAVLLPHAFESLGPAAFPLGLLGFAVPLMAERWLSRHRPGEAPGVLVVALAGLLVHEALDGAGLAVQDGHGHHHEATTLAILVHRLPVGLLVWWSVEPTLGRRATWAVLALMAGATTAGFALGSELATSVEGVGTGVLNALLSGALLHVIFDHGPEHTRSSSGTASALGAIAAAIVCWIMLPLDAVPHARAALDATLHLLQAAGPALLIGFAGAGLLTLVPSGALARLMTGSNVVTSAVRGAVFGLPLPVCSCGVVPIYRGLVQKGVPPAAAVAFLVATPELDVASVVVSVPLLGPALTGARLLAALVVALAAGVVAGRLARGAGADAHAPGCATACADTACEDEAPAAGSPTRRALRYACVDSVDELAPWILAGLLVAGALEPLLRPEWLGAVPLWAQVPLATLIAAPLYVCASAATPVAAVLLGKGLSAGAVIAFLLAGPATNVTTWGALRSGHRRGAALAIVGTILVSCVLVGLAIDALGVRGLRHVVAGVGEEHGLASQVAAGVFLLLCLGSFLRVGPRGFLAKLGLVHRHGHAPSEPCDDEPGKPADEHGHDHDHGHGHGHDHDHDHDHDHPAPAGARPTS
jgi:uncharacterized membrane protein YraQ (UPF0718 family)